MKVLFLDIDGVCNHQQYYKSAYYIGNDLQYPLSEFDPLVVNRINEILDKTNAKLVLSSSWRFTDNIQNILTKVGFTHLIYDITPYGMGKDRGYEIKAYLNSHPDITNYVIIDDINEMLPEQQNHFIQTSDQYGLTEELKNKVIKILKV